MAASPPETSIRIRRDLSTGTGRQRSRHQDLGRGRDRPAPLLGLPAHARCRCRWISSTTRQERQEVISVISGALQSFGKVQERSWGDVVSIELLENEKGVFSFQIADRSARLRPPHSAGWTEVLLDSFPDLVASKMVALVERGVPRDFRDIYALCQAGLTNAAQAWQWWRERQQLSGSDTNAHRARLAVTTHLMRIAQHRPLAAIADAAERESAEQVRHWFAEVFLDAVMD